MERKKQAATAAAENYKLPPREKIIFEPVLSAKEKYKDQFNKAMKLIMDRENQGLRRKYILKELNEKEYKTRTGKNWTSSILSTEIKKYKSLSS